MAISQQTPSYDHALYKKEPAGSAGKLGKAWSLDSLRPAAGSDQSVAATVWFVNAGKLLGKATLPAGARWITVHPNGPDAPGVPVMIQETHPGSGTYHVIGGAGGKLNYLKLHGVKPAGDHRAAALERRKTRELVHKEQVKREKAAGTYQAKQAARKQIKAEAKAAEHAFVRDVAAKMGWDPKEVAPPPPAGASKEAEAKIAREHHAALLKRATEAVALQRRRLLEDAEARAEALGDGPLTDKGKPESLSVADLDPVKPATGAGFAPGWGKQAREQGLTKEQVKQEKAAFEATLPEERRETLTKRRASAAAIKQEVDRIAPEKPAGETPHLLDAQQAAELLRAEKRLKAIKAQARAANKKIDAAPLVDPNATVLEVGKEEVPDTLREDLENDLRTFTARSLLDRVRQDVPDYEQSLTAHLEAGAMASLNGVAVAASGAGMMSRAALNTLGIAGAAKAVAARLHADLSREDLDALLDGLERYHADTQVATAQAAMDQAKAALDVSQQLTPEPAVTGHDLAMAQEINRKRIAAIDEARATLGSALGSLEMQGALVAALRAGAPHRLEIPLGDLSVESAIVRARALGLGPEDYRLSDTGGLRYLEIQEPAKLTAPIDRDELATAREIAAIQAGERDETDWLPEGVANRPDLALDLPAGVAERIGEPFTPGPDIGQSIRDYVGGRTADGDAPADILADLQSDELASKAPNRREYTAALARLIPNTDAKGKLLRAEAHAERFQQWADEFAERRYGGRIAPLHRQSLPVDDITLDALHRALSKEPAGVAAYKPIGELTGDDQRTLRAYWQEHIGSQDEAAKDLREQIREHGQQEPARYVEDMFGEQSENPQWSDWSGRRQELQEALGAKGLDWDKYQQVMGGRPQAYAAVQDLIRSEVSGAFAEAHNRLRPQAPLKLGRAPIRGNLEHLDAVDPAMREQRLAEQRELTDRLRERNQGRYAEGSVTAKIAGARERQAAMEQAQMGFFALEPEPKQAPPPLAVDQRHTLGQAAERQLAALMGTVGPNFKPGQPVKLWNASMSGRHVLGQRAIKMIERGKRVALGLGVGTGKTLIGLGAFTHLHAQGKAHKGLFVVPASVQGQVGAEALRYLEPGKYRWHASPGASREERLAAYRDPDTHFAVVTHQALRDDLLHLGAQRAGVSPPEMASRINAMTPKERAGWAKELMTAEGINPDYLMVDEGHNLLNRAGKQNSSMANVLDAVAHNSPYYVSASADPIRNDLSELHDLLRKMDPERYADRGAFMQRYGVDTPAVKGELRREVNRYLLTGRTDPGVAVQAREVAVEPSGAQRAGLQHIDALAARARLARMKGGVDVEALRELSPESFEPVPKGQHEALARKLSGNLGILRDAALRKELDNRGRSAKLDHAVRLAGERKGKPGVIFAHNLAVVRDLTDRLKAAGHRVATITGDMSGAERDAARRAFQPEQGEASADVLVLSDAGATGLNLQRGQWLVQYDTPMTAMVHAQRRGRIHRLGQQNPVEFLDLVANHPHEQAARHRLATKYELRDILTDPTLGQDDTGLAGYLTQARNQPQAGLF